MRAKRSAPGIIQPCLPLSSRDTGKRRSSACGNGPVRADRASLLRRSEQGGLCQSSTVSDSLGSSVARQFHMLHSRVPWCIARYRRICQRRSERMLREAVRPTLPRQKVSMLGPERTNLLNRTRASRSPSSKCLTLCVLAVYSRISAQACAQPCARPQGPIRQPKGYRYHRHQEAYRLSR